MESVSLLSFLLLPNLDFVEDLTPRALFVVSVDDASYVNKK